MITWNHTINIILETFDSINQQELAAMLGVTESVLSKIKSGKRKAPFNSDVVFNAVFDPTNPRSPAKDKPAFHLGIIKDIISKPQYEEVKKDMKDCWNEEDYNIFVKTLIKRTKNHQHQRTQSVPITTQTLIEPDKDIETIKQQVVSMSPSRSIIQTDISLERKQSGQLAILPHSGDCCYQCVYWNGNRKTFGGYTTATYGVCLKYNRQEQLSSDFPCKDYKKRQKLIGEW